MKKTSPESTRSTEPAESEGIRLQKYLSRAGRASRREAERLMLEGRVRVNGKVTQELGVRVVPGRDLVELDGEPVTYGEVRWIAFHKPPGVLTTRSDPHGGRTVYDVLPPELGTLRYVGRLDRPTEGLLLLTNDGDVANGIQHPSRRVEREYLVVANGDVKSASLDALRTGVELEDGPARAASVRIVERSANHTTLRLVLTEGRKREVRRMLLQVGHGVHRLVRLRFGAVKLGDLEAGAWRDLRPDERQALVALAGSKQKG